MLLKLADQEKVHAERKNELQSLERELAAVMEEYAVTEQDLTSKVSLLAPLDKQLRVSQNSSLIN